MLKQSVAQKIRNDQTAGVTRVPTPKYSILISFMNFTTDFHILKTSMIPESINPSSLVTNFMSGFPSWPCHYYYLLFELSLLGLAAHTF
jgi:hypothetical protein